MVGPILVKSKNQFFYGPMTFSPNNLVPIGMFLFPVLFYTNSKYKYCGSSNSWFKYEYGNS